MAYDGDLYVYDGDCVMCSRFVRFLISKDTHRRFMIMRAQSAPGREMYRTAGLDPDLMETALLRIDGRIYQNLDVFTETLSTLGWPWRMALVLRLLPRPLADWIYRRIANNRQGFQTETCPLPTPEMQARLIE